MFRKKEKPLLAALKEEVIQRTNQKKDELLLSARSFDQKKLALVIENIKSFVTQLLAFVVGKIQAERLKAELIAIKGTLAKHLSEMDRSIREAQVKMTAYENASELLEGKMTFDWQGKERRLGNAATWGASLVEGLLSAFAFLGLLQYIPVAAIVSVIFLIAFKAVSYSLSKLITDAETVAGKVALWFLTLAVAIILFGAMGFIREKFLQSAHAFVVPTWASIILSSFFFVGSVLIGTMLLVADKAQRDIKRQYDMALKGYSRAEIKYDRLVNERTAFEKNQLSQIAEREEKIAEVERYRVELAATEKQLITLYENESAPFRSLSTNNHIPFEHSSPLKTTVS